jgi:NUMOD4 motif/HNH endonuclease
MENWKPIQSWEELYEISDLGKVKSLRTGRILKPWNNDKRGYLRVDLCDATCKRVEKPLVHVLVLTAFVGPCPPGQEARHLNGIPGNNALSNLLWGTKVENYADRVRHSTDNAGERGGSARLIEEQVLQIRARPMYRGYLNDLAQEFGIVAGHVSNIRAGRKWKHLMA